MIGREFEADRPSQIRGERASEKKKKKKIEQGDLLVAGQI